MTDGEKIQAIKRGKPFKFADIFVFAAAIALIIILFIALYAKEGAYVEIVTPTHVYTYPLSQNRILEVDGCLTAEIKDGKVSVTASNCPDKVCVHTGAVSRANQIIACLPNGIIIRIRGLSDTVEVG